MATRHSEITRIHKPSEKQILEGVKPRRHSVVKWSLLVLVASSIALGVLLAWPYGNSSEAVAIGFAGYTNHNGVRLAMFAATNYSTRPIRYAVQIERKGD